METTKISFKATYNKNDEKTVNWRTNKKVGIFYPRYSYGDGYIKYINQLTLIEEDGKKVIKKISAIFIQLQKILKDLIIDEVSVETKIKVLEIK